MKMLRYLPKVLFDFALTLSASSYVVVVYLIKNKIALPFLPAGWEIVSYVLYVMLPVLIAGSTLLVSRYLPACDVGCEIIEVELASHSFLPNYLGYFFVALSVPDFETLLFVYAIILVYTHFSMALSFNPIFLLFRYQFYFVTGEDGARIFLITKQKMKAYKDVTLNDLRRINDFTFIDMR